MGGLQIFFHLCTLFKHTLGITAKHFNIIGYPFLLLQALLHAHLDVCMNVGMYSILSIIVCANHKSKKEGKKYRRKPQKINFSFYIIFSWMFVIQSKTNQQPLARTTFTHTLILCWGICTITTWTRRKKGENRLLHVEKRENKIYKKRQKILIFFRKLLCPKYNILYKDQQYNKNVVSIYTMDTTLCALQNSFIYILF